MSWNIINIIFAEYLMSKSDCLCRNYAVKHLLDNMINTLQMSPPPPLILRFGSKDLNLNQKIRLFITNDIGIAIALHEFWL